MKIYKCKDCGKKYIKYGNYTVTFEEFECPECSGTMEVIEQQELPLCGVLDEINDNGIAQEALVETFYEQFVSDEDSYMHKCRGISQAFCSGTCNEMLMALCGWSMESLVDLMGLVEYKE